MEILTSPVLTPIPWLEHGFGTRHAPQSQNGMASLKQIHSPVALVADRPEGCVGAGDALLTWRPGVTVSVRTADCYPILLADVRRKAVAAVHAGWRGTADGIVGKALEKMRMEFGTEPEDVVAAIGPGIGGCCYEVGVEVAGRFGASGAGKLDLASENLRQLTRGGVPRERITVAGACTFCNPVQYFSYRREREAAGRMISYIGIKH